jgi:chemotaxis protein MotB
MRRIAILAVLLLSGPLGCVTAETYNAMLAERDALATDKGDLEAEVATLKGEVSELDAANREHAENLAATTQEVSTLKSTHDQLLKDLKTELASGQVQIEQLRDGIRLSVANEILFDSGSAKIADAGRNVLEKVAAQVKDSPNRVQVMGHTDDKPIRKRLQERYPTNWELAAARASRVVRLLEEQGVKGTQMQATSLAEYHPVAPNESDEGRAQNRRIEIRLLPPLEATTYASD